MRALIAMAVVAGTMELMTRSGYAETPLIATGDATQALGNFSRASEAFYQKVSHSIVRVKVDQIQMPRELQKEFDEFFKKEIAAYGGPKKRPAKEEGMSGLASTMPARPGRLQLARRFLEQKLKDTTDPDMQAKIRLTIARVGAIKNGQTAGEILAVVIDNDGHAIVGGWSREMQAGGTMHVTVPDGSDLTATYVGANMGRGLAVLKLSSPGSTVPAGMAAGRPNPGALMMSVTPQGAVSYMTAPGQGKKADDRFPITGEDHGMMFLFNTQGELTAIGMEKQALPIDNLKNEIQWIIDNNKDIQPRRMGVKYDPITADIRRSVPALGNRPAVVVKEIQPGSPADKSGLKKNDIVVSIDNKPIWQLAVIQRELSMRTGGVPMEIYRDGKEMTIDLQLGD